MDYESWSRGFNMHFGYWRKGIHPLSLEKMLEEMNRQVLLRLELSPESPAEVADFGCGLGATLRFARTFAPPWTLNGLSLVPWQIEQAQARSIGMDIRYTRQDYTQTEFADASLDGVWALESSCHAGGLGKEAFVQEVARVLKPGKRLVVADGFLKHTRPMNPVYKRCYEWECEFWALETFAGQEAFAAALEKVGFTDVKWQEISMRIAPSVLFVPIITVKYFFQQIFLHKQNMTRERWRHIAACLLSPVIGLARKRFGYYILTATRS